MLFCVCPSGVFAFGLFATDIFVNAGQVVTGGLSPYFLSICKPNYTGTECRFNHQFIVNGNICTGNPVVVENARRSFPSKEASLSVYSAVYLTVSCESCLCWSCYGSWVTAAICFGHEAGYTLADCLSITEPTLRYTDRQTFTLTLFKYEHHLKGQEQLCVFTI